MFEQTGLIYLISNVGFPIFVALYLLIRIERVINNNTKAIVDLDHAMKNLVRQVNKQ